MIQRFDAFVSGITLCYKYIQRIKAAEMEGFGLKGAHAMCLHYLHQSPQGLTCAQLSSLCAEDKAAVSRTVSELRGLGYVASLSGKTYRAPLQLTEAGKSVYQKMVPLIRDWVSAGGLGLTDEVRAEFYRGMAVITGNLRAKMENEPNLNKK